MKNSHFLFCKSIAMSAATSLLMIDLAVEGTGVCALSSFEAWAVGSVFRRVASAPIGVSSFSRTFILSSAVMFLVLIRTRSLDGSCAGGVGGFETQAGGVRQLVQQV